MARIRRRRKTTTRKRRLTTFQRCIGKELKGKKFSSKATARSAFRAAVKKCK